MIIVFGSLNIDMVMPVDHFPKPGETVLCAADYLSRPGGKGANQALAAARAGAKVAIVGKVGDDAFGRRSVNNLKTQGIWTSGIAISERPTGCSTIMVDRNGANMVTVAPGANLDAFSGQVPDDVLTAKNIVLAQLETRPEEAFSVLSRARELGVVTILNAAPAENIALPGEALKTADYVIVNEIEARQLGHMLGVKGEEAPALAREIARITGNACIVTAEEQGCFAARDGRLYAAPALAVDVVDTTGAGDAFCGIFAACLQDGMDWLDALRHATTGASLSCLGLGAQAGMPFMEDIKAALPRVPAPGEVAG